MTNLGLEEIRRLALARSRRSREAQQEEKKEFKSEQELAEKTAALDLPRWIKDIHQALINGKGSVTNCDWIGCEGSQLYINALKGLLGEPFGVRNHLSKIIASGCYTEVYWK